MDSSTTSVQGQRSVRGPSSIQPRRDGVNQRPVRLFVVALTYSVLIPYWFLTVAYILPNNYLKAVLAPALNRFQLLFYQRWEFFAPPPEFNYRLYAIARRAGPEQSTVSLDLMSEVIERKRLSAPFNDAENAIDYLLFGAIYSIDGILSEAFSAAKKTHPDRSDDVCMEMARTALHDLEESDPSIRSLRNYARLALERHFRQADIVSFHLRITRLAIPKFAKAMRGELGALPEELLLVETKEMPFQP